MNAPLGLDTLAAWVTGALSVPGGVGALIAVLIVVLSVSVATVVVCGWLEWHEEAVQRSRSAEERMARRKGGCAVRSR